MDNIHSTGESGTGNESGLAAIALSEEPPPSLNGIPLSNPNRISNCYSPEARLISSTDALVTRYLLLSNGYDKEKKLSESVSGIQHNDLNGNVKSE